LPEPRRVDSGLEYFQDEKHVVGALRKEGSHNESKPQKVDMVEGEGGFPMLQAQLVEDIDEDERLKIIEQTKKEMQKSAVNCEVFVVDEEQELLEKLQQRRRMRCCILLTILVTVGVVVGVLFGTDVMDDDYKGNPTLAPTTYEEGGSSFTRTEQLYQAVDDYFEALLSDSPETSSVALRYGYPISTWDVSKVTSFRRLFDVQRSLGREFGTKQKGASDAQCVLKESLAGWNTSSAEDMFGMFFGCDEFAGEGVETFDVSRVKDFSYAFSDAKLFSADLSQWNTESAESFQVSLSTS